MVVIVVIVVVIVTDTIVIGNIQVAETMIF